MRTVEVGGISVDVEGDWTDQQIMEFVESQLDQSSGKEEEQTQQRS